MKTDNTQLFESMPPWKAVMTLAIPTVISQIITVIYNMADTYFIGKLNNPCQVAAATLSLPIFALLIGIANIFGIGGASMISRSLGAGDKEKASRCSCFCIWASFLCATFYGMIMLFFRPYILPAIGANADTYQYCFQYTFWTIAVGATPTVLSAVMANLVRAEGYGREASWGIAFGSILNMVLDPIFIFVFNMEIAGAAFATMLSNLSSAIFLLVFICKNRKSIVITASLRYFSLKNDVARDVITVGFPSALMSLTSVISNILLYRLIASYSTEAIAGMGIAKKIDMLAFAIASGMAQGTLPLIGYNFAAGNFKRMKQITKTSYIYSLAIAICGGIVLYCCAVPISRGFIDNDTTIAFAQYFLRIICITCPCVSVTLMAITFMQAIGLKVPPMIISVMRKGGIDIIAMLLMNKAFGIKGIAWAAPIADCGAMIAAIIFFVNSWRTFIISHDMAQCRKESGPAL